MPLKSVLIVDDNEVDRMLLKRLLTKGEITDTIFECIDGSEALNFLTDYESKRDKDPEKYPPMLVFLDINMPKVNGFEFLEHFSKIRNENKDLKTVILTMFTSSSNEEDKVKALAYDFVKDYLVKGSKRNSQELKDFLKSHFPDL